MALSQNSYVYMETVETAENKEKKSNKDGNTRILRKYCGEQSERTLENLQQHNGKTGNDKRKTDKQWLL